MINNSDPFGLCPPQNNDTWDCGSEYFAQRIAQGKGIWLVNQIAGVINACNEDDRCGQGMWSMLSQGMATARGGQLGLTVRDVGAGRISSIGQMKMQVQRGQAPRGVVRADRARTYKEQDNVHFSDGSTLNRDGSWKHKGTTLTNEQKEWLIKGGFRVP